ncbi:hypothetical protein ASG90_15810 [Nocardioides sp. Soil797]|nr:hypothetical protein ASG90_15810 [Nocardioides sp. Soil797]
MFWTRTARAAAVVVLIAAVAAGCSGDGDSGTKEKSADAEFAGFCEDFTAHDPHEDYKTYQRTIVDLWKSEGAEAVPPSARAGYQLYVDIVRVAYTASGYDALQGDVSDDDAADLKAFEEFVSDEC